MEKIKGDIINDDIGDLNKYIENVKEIGSQLNDFHCDIEERYFDDNKKLLVAIENQKDILSKILSLNSNKISPPLRDEVMKFVSELCNTKNTIALWYLEEDKNTALIKLENKANLYVGICGEIAQMAESKIHNPDTTETMEINSPISEEMQAVKNKTDNPIAIENSTPSAVSDQQQSDTWFTYGKKGIFAFLGGVFKKPNETKK
ncbi:MAG: hypothetical protein LBI69_01445 [Puniceicoccales bacterium]|jgi:hypothetical protein|nr:hypothetical protein [Puniceicoccales bacterium]